MDAKQWQFVADQIDNVRENAAEWSAEDVVEFFGMTHDEIEDIAAYLINRADKAAKAEGSK